MAGYDQYVRISDSQQAGGVTATSVSSRIFGSASSQGGATIKYLSAPGTVAPAAAAVVLGVATQACTIQNLVAYATTAPAGSDTVIYTVMVSTDSGANFSATALTCTITGAAVTNSDTTNSVAVAAGSLIAIRVNNSATTAAGLGASLEIG